MKKSSSKTVVKHALRQQAKRRRKNTTIAAGNVAPVPRIIHPSNKINSNYHNSDYYISIEYNPIYPIFSEISNSSL